MTVPETQTQTPVMTAAALYDALLHNTAPYILDVRNPDDFARWRIEGRAGLMVENIPYYNFIEDEDGAVARVPANREVLVVCAKEGSSQFVADLLRARGVNASYLEGGILSWGHLYDTRDIVVAPWGRIVQVARPARGDVSFIVISDGAAAVIDPLRHNSALPGGDCGAWRATDAYLRYPRARRPYQRRTGVEPRDWRTVLCSSV